MKRCALLLGMFFMSVTMHAEGFGDAVGGPEIWDTLPSLSFDRLFKEFSSPGKDYGSAPLWVWNTRVTNELIDSMLQAYKDNGFGGAFVHPRAGLITEYLSADWFALWKHAMEKSRELGLNLWIYDEDSYPSGFAGGHVPYTMPSSYDQGQMLEMHKDSVFPADVAGYVICLKKDGGRFMAVTDGAAENGRTGEYYLFKKQFYYRSPWYGGFSYTDLMAKSVTEQFIAQTMRGYEASVGDEFGKTVKGIFSDEPNIEVQYPGCVRWTPDLFDAYYKKWGYRLEEQLPSLLEDVGDWKKVRHDYYAILLQLFIDRWSKPYSAYTAAHHLEWTGHYWEHEWPDPNHVPDNMAMYAWPQRPGIDMLFNQFDENNVNAQFGNVRSVKELASVANQLGKRRTLCETYGGGGWELRFKDMKRLGDWEFALGINTLDQHLSFMTIAGARKYDYPQSFSYQTPWWPYYKWLNVYFTRLSWALTRGEQQNKILILEPTTTAWMYAAHGAEDKKMMELGSRFQAFITKLEKAQVEYDLGSEDIIRDHGRVAGDQFVIGERSYALVIIPPGMENIDSATYGLLKKYCAGGGRVMAFGKLERLDGSRHSDLMHMIGSARLSGTSGSKPADTVAMIRGKEGSGAMNIQVDPGGRGDLYHHRRVIRDGQFLFLSNADIDSSVSGRFSLPGSQVLAMDLFTGEIRDYPCRIVEGMANTNFELPPAGSMLFFVSAVKHEGVRKYKAPPTVIKTGATAGATIVHRPAFNTLSIDFCDLRIGDTLLKEKHVYDAADTVFKHYGFSDGDPWNTSIQFKSNTIARDTFSAGTGFEAAYHFTIGSGVDYSHFRAVVEQPSLWQVSVNGHAIRAEPGQWWLDKSFAVYEAGQYMKAGENVLGIKANPMSVYAEIEPVYILGDFGLTSADKGWGIVAPVPLRIGSWKDQGLPLYGQGIRYSKEFNVAKSGRSIIVRLGKWKGTMAAVRVNGSLAGIMAIDPYQLDISSYLRPGRNRVEVEVIGSLKNLLGPHHGSPKPGMVSPWHWRYVKSYPPGREYDTLDYGLLEDFEILGL